MINSIIPLVLVFLLTGQFVHASVLQTQELPKSKEVKEREKFLEAENLDDINRFTGEGELGFTITSGNTNSEALNAKLNTVYEKVRWRHSVEVRIQEAQDNNQSTVNRKVFGAKSDYRMGQRSYLYGSFRYEDDAFSGFEFQRSTTVGIGWRVIRSESKRLDLETGTGYKQTETILNEKINEEILRLYGKYMQHLSETAMFTQEFLMEAGDDNTLSESLSSLKVSVNEKLALKLGLHVKKSSTPPIGNKAVDKTTVVTLVYGF